MPGNFLRPSWKGFAALCILAAFLTFTGVYDAVKTLPIGWGWAYWMLTLIVGCLVGFVMILGLSRLRAHVLTQYGGAMLASTTAVTCVIVGLQYRLDPQISFNFLPPLFLQVLVISIAVFAIGLMFERAFEKPSKISENKSDPVKHFLEHLPMKYRDAELYAVSSEDHYLRVHTSKGEELILMRLSDAIHALKEADGLQTHRSWWVAANGVLEVQRADGRVELVLKSDVKAPVSRTYQPAIKV